MSLLYEESVLSSVSEKSEVAEERPRLKLEMADTFLRRCPVLAFVLSRVIGARSARKLKNTGPIRASGLRGSRSAEFQEEASGSTQPSSLPPDAELPAIPRPTLAETDDSDLDWSFGADCAGKTPGEILSMMFPQTRGVEKQHWKDVKDSPENKKDLDLMLACCMAEIEKSQSKFVFPASECFKRVASLLRKQKDYARELGVVGLYWQLCDSVFEEVKRRDGLRAQLMAQHSALKAGFKKRYDKAQLLLESKKKCCINVSLVMQNHLLSI